MSLIGDLFGSINPFSSENERDEHQQNIGNRFHDFVYMSEDRKAQNKLDNLKAIGILGGLDLADDMADHYQDANGKTLNIPKEKIRRYETVLNAEAKNQDRLIGSLNKPDTLQRKTGQSFEPVRLSDLKDSDEVVLNDYYDIDNDYKKYGYKNPDLAMGLGSFKIQSKSNLRFKKSGNKLLPYGYVNHQLNNEVYDFNKGSNYRQISDPLEDSGKAIPYKVKSEWKTYPMGVININDDNELDASGLEWNLIP